MEMADLVHIYSCVNVYIILFKICSVAFEVNMYMYVYYIIDTVQYFVIEVKSVPFQTEVYGDCFGTVTEKKI